VRGKWDNSEEHNLQLVITAAVIIIISTIIYSGYAADRLALCR